MIRALIGATTLLFCGATCHAAPVDDFYRGRSIQLIVGYGPGGGYDVYSRLIARYFPKYMPGTPNVVVQNMPGAGSLISINHLYSAAPRDGSVIGSIDRNMPLLGLLGVNKSVRFDAQKFTWLGSSSNFEEDSSVMWVRKSAKVQNIREAQGPGGVEILLGGTGQGATGNDVALILRDTLNINIKQVPGYPDSNAINLAIERGEIDGRIADYSSIASSRPSWLAPDSIVRPLLQFARVTRHPAFADVPTARELATGEKLQVLELAELPNLMSRPYAAPPAIPEDRAQALRKAFMETHADPDFVAEAAKLGVGISPIDGDAVLAAIEKIRNAPAKSLDQLRAIFEAREK
jgi:tripartite-type tricarboxylate transporter receptor subunit TctC